MLIDAEEKLFVSIAKTSKYRNALEHAINTLFRFFSYKKVVFLFPCSCVLTWLFKDPHLDCE